MPSIGELINNEIGDSARKMSVLPGTPRQIAEIRDHLIQGGFGKEPLPRELLDAIQEIRQDKPNHYKAFDEALSFLSQEDDEIQARLKEGYDPDAHEEWLARLAYGFEMIAVEISEEQIRARREEMMQGAETFRQGQAITAEQSMEMVRAYEVYEQGRFKSQLRDVATLLLTEQDPRVIGFLSPILEEMGTDVPDDVVALISEGVPEQIKAISSVFDHTLSAEDLKQRIEQYIPSTELLESMLLAMKVEVQFVLEGGEIRKCEVGVAEVLNFLNGDIGTPYEIGSNLPAELVQDLMQTYPELKSVLDEIVMKDPSGWSDEARNLSGRKLWRSDGGEPFKKATSGLPVSEIPVGMPIIMSELSVEEQNRAALEARAYLDIDPLEVDSLGKPKRIIPGEELLTLDGRKHFKHKSSEWVKYVVTHLAGIEDWSAIVAIEPGASFYTYDKLREQQDYGLMNNRTEASIEHWRVKNLSSEEARARKLVAEVFSVRLARLFSLAESLSDILNTSTRFDPVTTQQTKQAILRPHLGEAYYEQYDVMNPGSRRAGETYFADWMSRLLSKHSVIQALKGERRLLAFRDPLNIEFEDDDEAVQLKPIRFENGALPAAEKAQQEWKQKELVESIVAAEKPKPFQNMENTAVLLVVNNMQRYSENGVTADAMTWAEAEAILDRSLAERMNREGRDGMTGVKIKRSRQEEYALLAGLPEEMKKLILGMNFEDTLRSMGEDVTKLTDQEKRGAMGLTLVLSRDGIEQYQISKVRQDLLKHYKYLVSAEKVFALQSQEARAHIQSMDQEFLTSIGIDLAKPRDFADAYYKGITSLLNFISRGKLQFSGDVRSQYFQGLMELKTQIADSYSWMGAGQVRRHMMAHVTWSVQQVSDMIAQVSWKLAKEKVGYEEVEPRPAPGFSQNLVELDLEKPTDQRLALLLRKKGFRIMVPADGNKAYVIDASNRLYYQMNGQFAEGYWIPKEYRESYLSNFDHHSALTIGNAREAITKALAMQLKDAGVIDKVDYNKILSSGQGKLLMKYNIQKLFPKLARHYR